MMRRVMKGCALGAIVFLVLWVLQTLSACAVGRGPAGEIVLGVEAGALAETAEHGITALGNLLLPGLGGTLAAVLVPVIGWARAHANARAEAARRAAEEQARKDVDQAWDESEARARGASGGRHAAASGSVVDKPPATPAKG